MQPKVPQAPVKPEAKCSIEGTVVSATTGAPLKRARLILQPIGGAHPIPYGTTTDSTGHFVIDEIDAGRYHLAASRSRYLAQSYSPHGNSKQSTTMALENGHTMKEIGIKLMPQRSQGSFQMSGVAPGSYVICRSRCPMQVWTGTIST